MKYCLIANANQWLGSQIFNSAAKRMGKKDNNKI